MKKCIRWTIFFFLAWEEAAQYEARRSGRDTDITAILRKSNLKIFRRQIIFFLMRVENIKQAKHTYHQTFHIAKRNLFKALCHKHLMT